MSFWPFGQNANSALNLNRLLDEYYYNRSNINEPPQSNALEPSASIESSDQASSQIHGKTANGSTPGPSNEQEERQSIRIDRDFVNEVLDDTSLLTELGRQNNKLIDFICFGYINDEQDQDHEMTNADEDNGEADEVETVSKQQAQGTAILEILLDIVLDSVQWFKDNEEQLYKISEHQLNEDDEATNELTIVFNRIHTASEILSSKIWLISETLVEEPLLLTRLWGFLDNNFQTSSPSIPYFNKINEQLLDSRPDQMLNFIRSQTHLVESFLKHINITIIMDFLLKIITTDKPDNPTGILDLLSEQDLIAKLLDILHTSQDTAIQSSCGDFIKALIAISANTSIDEHTIGPNILTKELVSNKSIDKIIEIILLKGNGLSTAVGIIIEIIRKNNSDYDTVNLLYTTTESNPPNKRDPIYLGGMLRKFSQRLPEFRNILLDKELCSKRIENQINEKIEPLGFERFKICELIAELLHCSNITLLNNHLTEKIIEERENFLNQQEFNLKNALSEDLVSINNKTSSPSPGSSQFNGFSSLNIGGTSEPSVALSSKHITISPHPQPEIDPMASITEEDDSVNSLGHRQLPQQQFPVLTKREQLRANPTVGDSFKIALIDSEVIVTIIRMFIKFPWNNFWHNVVFDIVQQIFNGRLDISYNPYLIVELFDQSDITNLIIDAYNLCIDTENSTHVRLGYMGHLILIAEEVVKFSSIFQNSKFNDTEVDELIYTKLIDEKWINFVTNILTETREMYNCVLGGIKANEFSDGDYTNHNAIVLGNSEEEILNQPVDDQEVRDESQEEDGSTDQDVFYDTKDPEDQESDKKMTS